MAMPNLEATKEQLAIADQLTKQLDEAINKVAATAPICSHQFASIAAATLAHLAGQRIGYLIATGHFPDTPAGDEQKMMMVVGNFAAGEADAVARFGAAQGSKAVN